MQKLSKLKNRRFAIWGLLLFFIFTNYTLGCDHEEWQVIESIEVNHSLHSFDNLASFEAYAKTAATQLMRAQVEVARNQEASWADLSGGGPMANDSADESSGASDSDGSGSGAASDTNNQEEGVQEADIVKHDGDHIYVLHNGELVIISVLEQGQMQEVGRVDVGGYAKEMFIYDQTAVVFSAMAEDEVPESIRYARPNVSDQSGIEPEMDMECIGPSCAIWGNYSQVAVLDISDKTNPDVLRTVIYAGKYETARLVNNAMRVVLYSPLPVLEMNWYWGDNYNYDSVSDINRHYKRVIDKNTDRFEALTIDDILPKKFDSADGNASYIVDQQNIWGPATPAGIGLSTIVSFDLEQPANSGDSLAVFGGKGIAYASTNSLYLSTSRDYVTVAVQSGLWAGDNGESSGVHKFDISRSDSAAFFLATGQIDGRLLNQFCMGEKDGFLRVATTTGSGWMWENDGEGNTLDNHVYVLEQKGAILETVGHLSGLGEGEEIYAARFMGDRGFLVTFFQTDPLFTLDLSDPYNPKTVGEWLGPGFSTYLHPYGENLIISVGLQDWRVALSLYDISNFAVPVLKTRLLFPNESYRSVATYEHKAFTFNSDTGFLALPFSDDREYETGIYTYMVDETGIEKDATMTLLDESNVNEGVARRSLYISDYLYGLSKCRITSAPLADPGNTVDSIALFTIGSCDDYGYDMGW